MFHAVLIFDELTDLIKTCKKKGHNACRFNFPLPPMPRTMILVPLSETDLEENVADKLKKDLVRICSLLDSIKADETMSCE